MREVHRIRRLLIEVAASLLVALILPGRGLAQSGEPEIFVEKDILKSSVWTSKTPLTDVSVSFQVGSLKFEAYTRMETPPPAGQHLVVARTGKSDTNVADSLGPDLELPGQFDDWAKDSRAQLAAVDVTMDGQPELLVALERQGELKLNVFQYKGKETVKDLDETKPLYKFKRIGVLDGQSKILFDGNKILALVGSQGLFSAYKWDAKTKQFLEWDEELQKFTTIKR